MHSKGNAKGKTKTLRIGKILADKDTHNELVCNTHMNELEYTQTAPVAPSKIETTSPQWGGEGKKVKGYCSAESFHFHFRFKGFVNKISHLFYTNK